MSHLMHGRVRFLILCHVPEAQFALPLVLGALEVGHAPGLCGGLQEQLLLPLPLRREPALLEGFEKAGRGIQNGGRDQYRRAWQCGRLKS